MTRVWKVYGEEGHRQRESFAKSTAFVSSYDKHITVQLLNSDITHTNEFSIVKIDAPTAKECEEELWAQLSDGVFENSHTGKIEEIEL